VARGQVVYFDHEGSDCRDRYHRRCTGRWRGELSLGKDGQGKRRRRKVSAKSKAELLDKLDELRSDLDQGIRSSRSYTVAQAVDEWLAGPMADRAPKTIQTQREILEPLTGIIGQIALRDLTADDVSKALIKIAETRSTRTVRDTRASLVRAVTYAQARGKVGRNVAALIKAPQGKAPGRPSKALTVTQALAVLKAAENDRLYAYFVLSLLTGMRTEEARALRWDHVHLDVPTPYVAVWRSVRAGGDVKTRTSRRSLALPERAVEALEVLRVRQDKEREEAPELWHETGLVFTTGFGTALNAGNVRRSFRRICSAAGIGENWTPRELRHSFVSIMSDSGVPIERIADLVGHAGGSRVTEQVYRMQLRPVLTEGAEVMERALQPKRKVRRSPRRGQLPAGSCVTIRV
jgi:integrase